MEMQNIPVSPGNTTKSEKSAMARGFMGHHLAPQEPPPQPETIAGGGTVESSLPYFEARKHIPKLEASYFWGGIKSI